MHSQLLIRPARASDRAAVFAMVASVWDGTDYIPEVWDTWLADRSGPLLVGELAGQPVALAKLTGLSPGEDWFEGLRVAPEQRGKGLARTMLRACIAQSRQRGAQTLRYMTSQHNQIMQRVAVELGFRLCYAPLWHSATQQAGAPELRPLEAERLPALLDDLSRSPLLALSGGLYSYGWTTFELSAARLQAHLAQGHVLGLPGAAAWAIIEPADRAGWWLAHIEGAADELAWLCAALRQLLAPPSDAAAEAHIRAHLPPHPPLLDALAHSGYNTGHHDTYVYELGLGSSG